MSLFSVLINFSARLNNHYFSLVLFKETHVTVKFSTRQSLLGVNLVVAAVYRITEIKYNSFLDTTIISQLRLKHCLVVSVVFSFPLGIY